jgi:hypothetical protein
LLACAVCGASERALPANGSEVAFEDRKRATLDLRAAAFRTTTGPEVDVAELRAEPGAEAAVTDRLMLGGSSPVLYRTTNTDVLFAERRGAGAIGPSPVTREAMLGDVELRATYTAFRAIGRHLSLDGGVKLPTAPVERDAAGRLLAPDLQPGCSSVVPFVGATYLWSGSLASAWTSVSLLMPYSVRSAAHAGDSARASATLQLQPTRVLATRLGVFARYDSTAELEGEAVPRSGGGSVHVAPEIVLSPAEDLVVSFGAAFPLVQGMRAYRSTSPVLLASVGLDF